ncbi:hypothetical protein KY285_017684 [Solanum tuberosum]|nr:hypothetical protein KY284_017683 [Solanum tuberosum]KAH0690493.1 hypothetical protein KY289_017851 [Solanum tuberosum]KAH0703406.1 hypothetical protein KY285_017684 [Solanum tuberosum]
MRNEKELEVGEESGGAAKINGGGGGGNAVFFLSLLRMRKQKQWVLLEYKSSNIHNVGRSTSEETFRVFLIVTANILFPDFTPHYTIRLPFK